MDWSGLTTEVAVFEAERIIHGEHRNLIAVINCLRAMARDVETGKRIDTAVFHQAFDYVDRFLNAFHHPKEGRYLFAVLRRHRPDLAARLDELENQHARMPSELKAVREALRVYESSREANPAALRDAVETYARFELAHMRLEETEIMPGARESLTDEEWREIATAFENDEDPLFGSERRREFRRLFSTLVNHMPAPHGLGE